MLPIGTQVRLTKTGLRGPWRKYAATFENKIGVIRSYMYSTFYDVTFDGLNPVDVFELKAYKMPSGQNYSHEHIKFIFLHNEIEEITHE